MGEEKFASLSSGLLARKGAAKPAMRRQGYINPQGEVTEDLGWNDMGYEAPQPIDTEEQQAAPSAPAPDIHRQFDRLAEDFGAEAEDEGEDIRPEASAPLSAPEDFELPQDEDEVEDLGKYDARRIRLNGHGLSPVAPDETFDDEDEAEEVPAEPIAANNGEESEHVVPLVAKRREQPAAPTPQPASEDADRPAIAAEEVPAREKVAFTLRLDKDRHLRLRLASAVRNESAQKLVTAALDAFLDSIPEVDELAEKAPGRSTH